jgi:hypothetical protein
MSARDVIVHTIAQMTERGHTNGDAATAILSALAAAGYAVVPVEPTREMLLAAPGRTNQATEESMYHGIYRAMLAAAKETQA